MPGKGSYHHLQLHFLTAMSRERPLQKHTLTVKESERQTQREQDRRNLMTKSMLYNTHYKLLLFFPSKIMLCLSWAELKGEA